MDQVGSDTSLVLTIKLLKDFSPAVTLLPVLPHYVGNRNAPRIITSHHDRCHLILQPPPLTNNVGELKATFIRLRYEFSA